MTTREATHYLPRTEDVPIDLIDRLTVLAFAPVQAPWLLKSLWGGRRHDKARLLARLDLKPDALPHLGSWKADTGFLHQLVDLVEVARPATVVELGAGATSLVIGRALQLYGCGRLTSFDQHDDFVAATRAWLRNHGIDADITHAPLASPPKGWRGRWYSLSHLPATIDLLVVDGPHWALHPMVRGAAETLFARVSPGGTVILDDAARPGERLVARRWKRDWPDFDWRYVRGIKGTLIGVRRAD
jgi:predicted O-methyltransferase YrrM